MARNWFAIAVKLGLSEGSADQHRSISDLHSGSHDSGTEGRKVLLTIPPDIHMPVTQQKGTSSCVDPLRNL